MHALQARRWGPPQPLGTAEWSTGAGGVRWARWGHWAWWTCWACWARWDEPGQFPRAASQEGPVCHELNSLVRLREVGGLSLARIPRLRKAVIKHALCSKTRLGCLLRVSHHIPPTSFPWGITKPVAVHRLLSEEVPSILGETGSPSPQPQLQLRAAQSEILCILIIKNM